MKIFVVGGSTPSRATPASTIKPMTGPHDTPLSEGSVGTVRDVTPPWNFGPVAENVVAEGATREQGFKGTPTGECQLPTSASDPHDITVSRGEGEWRVPK